MVKYNNLFALVVDDDPFLRAMVEKELASVGIKVKGVGNGNEAIEALKAKCFDFVLMDVQMPVQDGLDAVRWILDVPDDYNRNIPIIAVTSFDTLEHTAEIIASGMNDHLVKPFNLEKLLLSLEKQFKKSN
jgi:CheY-like chemotaxis protein